MMFRSNNCMAIHSTDLYKAEKFYTEFMGFHLTNKMRIQLEYDTGHFLLYINKDAETQPPIPSFTVRNVKATKLELIEQGYSIIEDRGDSLYFIDPFGIIYDMVEG